MYTWTAVNLQPQGSPPEQGGVGDTPPGGLAPVEETRDRREFPEAHAGALTSGAQGGRGPQEVHFGDSEGWVEGPLGLALLPSLASDEATGGRSRPSSPPAIPAAAVES